MPNNTHEDALASRSHRRPDFVSQLISGDFGLAKTYWLFGVAAGLVYSFIADHVASATIFTLISLIYLCYWVAVSIGIWNAASKYSGNPIWAILAKVAVLLGFLVLAHGLYSIFV